MKSIPFRFVALAPETFAPLSALPDEALAAQNIRRITVDERPGYPCRVSLVDTPPGERVLLLSFTHQSVDSPFRASGPIFVREETARAEPAVGEVPEIVRGRLLSVRAYNAAGMLTGSEVCEDHALEAQIGCFFAQVDVGYLHVHNARQGCYFCRVDRA